MSTAYLNEGKRPREHGIGWEANPYGEDRPLARLRWQEGWNSGNPAVAVSYLSQLAVRSRQRRREKYLRRVARTTALTAVQGPS